MKNKYTIPLLLVTFANSLLFGLKFYIGLRTNSLCIYTDSLNNLLDALSALLSLVGTCFLLKQATKKHPYGFGRLEYLLEFCMALLVTITAALFAYHALIRLSMPTPVWFYTKYAWILGGTCAVKFCLGIYLYTRYKKTSAVLFKALYLDSFLDVAVTAVALTSFTLSNAIGVAIDGFLGLVISIFIAISGIRLLFSSGSLLLGEADTEKEKLIRQCVKDCCPEAEIRALTVISYGSQRAAATLRLAVPPTIQKAQVETKILEWFSTNQTIQLNISWEDTVWNNKNNNQKK